MVLTRLTVVLLALIALLGIVEQWLSGEHFPLWRISAAALAVALFFEWLLLRDCVIELRSPLTPRLRLGRNETLRLALGTQSSGPVYAELASGLPAELMRRQGPTHVSIAPMETTSISFDVCATEMGSVPWPRLPARVRGFLGLARWPNSVELNGRLNVVPDLACIWGKASGETRAGNATPRIGQGFELHHLRDYEAGDPLQAIDWKATARAQHLVSRVFSEEQHLDIILLIDAGRTSNTRVDGVNQYSHYCNTAARFAERALASGDHVGLVVAAAKPLCMVPPRGGLAAVSAIGNALSASLPKSEDTDLVAAAQEIERMLQRRALVVLLTDLYGQTPADNLARCVRFLRSRHYLITVGLLGDDIGALIETEASSRDAVYQSLAAQEFRDALKRNSQAMQQLGASSILARPKALHRSVFEEYRRLKQKRRL